MSQQKFDLSNLYAIRSIPEILKAQNGTMQLDAFRAGQVYRKNKPHLVNASPDLEALIDHHFNNISTPPDCHIIRINNCYSFATGILAFDNTIIKESLINLHDQSEFFNFYRDQNFLINTENLNYLNFDLANPVHIKQTWDEHYGHWLAESFPRAWLSKSLFPADNKNYILQPPGSQRMKEVYDLTMLALGITSERVHYIGNDTNIKYTHPVSYTSPLTIQPWIKDPIIFDAISHLQDFVFRSSGNKNDSKRRIYLSRRNQKTRRLINEDDVYQFFLRHNFSFIEPETLTFSQQIELFSNADLVCGVLGGGFSNLLFSPPGVKVLALAPPAMIDDFFWDIVSQKQGHYTSIHGVNSDNLNTMNSDFIIDIRALEESYHMLMNAVQ